MKKAPIVRFFIGLTMVINIIAYPIGMTITDPVRVNNLFSAVNFEKTFLGVFTSFASQQVSQNNETSTDDLEKEIRKNLISTDSLKKQREKAVENFYKSIANEEIPQLTFNLANPFTELKESISSNIHGIINDGLGLKSLCNQNPDSFVCSGLSSLFGVKLGEDEEDSLTSEKVTDLTTTADLFRINTSLGITNENIDTIYKIYRIAKYGPETLLVIDIVLLLIGYVTTLPSKNFARKIMFTFVKLDIFALAFWGAIPILISGLKPIRLSFSSLQMENNVNEILGNIFSEMAKTAFWIPAGFTLVAVAMYFIMPIFKRMGNNVQMGEASRQGRDYDDDGKRDNRNHDNDDITNEDDSQNENFSNNIAKNKNNIENRNETNTDIRTSTPTQTS